MASSGNEGIFKVINYDEAYWDNYLAARPKYHHDGFYDRLFAYHNAHSGRYDTAHDVGAGPGQVANMIAKHFKTVIASDSSETHLNICKHRNASIDNLSFILAPGEELGKKVPPASSDAIYSGEAVALMDTEVVISGFADVLKPNGTVAIWYYGRPAFGDGDHAKCQALYDKIVNRKFGRVIERGGPARAKGWKRASEIMASWLDCVAFPAEVWKDVERYKWNTHATFTFHDDEVYPYPIERSSAIGKDEKMVVMDDQEMWKEVWDVHEVRRFIDANCPSFLEEEVQDSTVEALYAELAEAMGGTAAKRSVVWPVVLLLATKR